MVDIVESQVCRLFRSPSAECPNVCTSFACGAAPESLQLTPQELMTSEAYLIYTFYIYKHS